MDWLPLLGIIVAVVVPIGLAIYAASRSRADRNDKRLDDHIAEDIKAHERLARLETKVETLEEEVASIRKRLHDALDYIKRGTWDLYQDFKAEVMRLIGK